MKASLALATLQELKKQRHLLKTLQIYHEGGGSDEKLLMALEQMLMYYDSCIQITQRYL